MGDKLMVSPAMYQCLLAEWTSVEVSKNLYQMVWKEAGK
jgi:hypothetical protein